MASRFMLVGFIICILELLRIFKKVALKDSVLHLKLRNFAVQLMNFVLQIVDLYLRTLVILMAFQA